MDNDHQGPEDVHSYGDKALLALGAVIFDCEREGITKHSVAFGKRHTMLLDVCRILLRIKIGGHIVSICTLYIYVNAALDRWDARSSAQRARLIGWIANAMTMQEIERISSRILTIRGHRVMIDADLAALYGVATKHLNQQVKRNPQRFPANFAFRLASAERTEVVTNCDHLRTLKYQPRCRSLSPSMAR